MKARKLQKLLPQAKVTRTGWGFGKTIIVQSGGLTYKLEGNAAGTEEEAAATLRSKLPVHTIAPLS